VPALRLKIEIASALKEEGLPLNGSEPSVKAPRGGLVIMHRAVQPLSEVAAKPAFRTIDGVSIRFVESNQRNADALLLFAAAAHPRRFLSLVVGSGGTAIPIRLGDP
jgi:hypothetical protein